MSVTSFDLESLNICSTCAWELYLRTWNGRISENYY